MEIENRRLDELTVAKNNSRTHSPQQVEQIAASMEEFGWTNPLLIDEAGGIIAGHGRRLAAMHRGETEGPCVVLEGLTGAQKRAYMIADNQLPLNAGWDLGMLKAEIEELQGLDFDIDVLGFDSSFLDELLADALPMEEPPVPEDGDQADPVTVEGDVWLLGDHRVMCGDSTSVDAVEALVGDERATLLHADPPYGMGKQKDGVQNDNLYREKLDDFQLEWWSTWRTFLTDNGSAYIWGNAPDLWRLWYAAGLEASEDFTLRNELVWDKKSSPGMKSDAMTQNVEATERCLYFQFGPQFLGNVNSDQYWEGWDEVRAYLEAQADAAGLTSKRCRDITGVQMFAHWFSKSQWSMISQKYYDALADALPGHFEKPYHELRAVYEKLKGGYRGHVNGIQGGMRAYFDNGHDIMRDVWDFMRVTGEERHGRATPKPVEMMERVMKTSLPRGGLCFEPFCGSGSTLMGAERTGRRCYTMELAPAYVDATVRRWQNFTGQRAVHAETGRLFDDCSS